MFAGSRLTTVLATIPKEGGRCRLSERGKTPLKVESRGVDPRSLPSPPHPTPTPFVFTPSFLHSFLPVTQRTLSHRRAWLVDCVSHTATLSSAKYDAYVTWFIYPLLSINSSGLEEEEGEESVHGGGAGLFLPLPLRLLLLPLETRKLIDLIDL